ncbi:tubby C-terminal-like domain-containing protein [Tricladium varicosporioides]|nr:tubby C-terminal-like domain-containing protein [Hymenoscyphus varicosporioides]
MAQIHLNPVNPPLGIFASYCVPKQTTLVMKEKVWSLSGDTFHIVDENGQEVVQCRGQTFSISDRKEFADAHGRPLFSLRTKLLSIHKSFYAEAPDGRELFLVKGKFSIGTSKMIATFVNQSNGQPVELLVKGDWLDRSATITMNGVVVAQISRSYFNMREIFGGQQTYYVTVAPHVDLALMAAVCVCLDEKENEK